MSNSISWYSEHVSWFFKCFGVGIYYVGNRLHNNNKTKYESLFYKLTPSLEAVDKVVSWADLLHLTRSSKNFSCKSYAASYGDINGGEGAEL
jgi:hypothetical protein